MNIPHLYTVVMVAGGIILFVAAAKKDPTSAQARELLRRLQLKQATPANAENSAPAQEASKLTSAVSELNKQPDSSAESHVALSKAQLALGEKEEAATNLYKALKVKPNVAVDPKLRVLIAAAPHSHDFSTHP